jgi:hypothetical protein
MSTHTRAKTRRQLRHPASRSQSHRQDKRQGEARQQTTWLGVAAPPRPGPRRNFGPLDGHEYTFDGDRWHRCQEPEEFADHLESESKRRSWYVKETTRKGVAVTMKRQVATPLEILTTTFAPWLSDWTAAQIKAGHDPRPKLAALRSAWLRAVQAALAGKRHLLGYAFHADTDDLHFDLILSRQDGLGGRIGDPGLLLVGPWCVGVDRQLRAGATIHPEKQSQLQRAVGNFRHRYGAEVKPLDVTLARALDAAADHELGEELRPFRAAYAKRVPELERQHTAAQLAVIEAAREKLLPAQNPAPEPNLPSL